MRGRERYEEGGRNKGEREGGGQRARQRGWSAGGVGKPKVEDGYFGQMGGKGEKGGDKGKEGRPVHSVNFGKFGKFLNKILFID